MVLKKYITYRSSIWPGAEAYSISSLKQPITNLTLNRLKKSDFWTLKRRNEEMKKSKLFEFDPSTARNTLIFKCPKSIECQIKCPQEFVKLTRSWQRKSNCTLQTYLQKQSLKGGKQNLWKQNKLFKCLNNDLIW